jgi:predicted nucleic acid-binding protein
MVKFCCLQPFDRRSWAVASMALAAQSSVKHPGFALSPLQDPRRADLLLTDLDRGEAEVIVLAQEQDAQLVILDERLARRHARRLGLSMTGTLGGLVPSQRAGLGISYCSAGV